MWIAALLVPAALVALLLVPADVSVRVERAGRTRVHMGIRWLFVRAEHEMTGRTGARKPRRKREKGRRTGAPLRTLAAVWRVPGLRKAGRRFLSRMASSVRVLGLAGSVRVGTSDPADTGRLWALVWPVARWCNRSPRIRLGVTPDFVGAGLTGEVEGTLRLYPGRFAYGVVSTLLSPTTLRLLLAIARSRP